MSIRYVTKYAKHIPLNHELKASWYLLQIIINVVVNKICDEIRQAHPIN